MTSQPFCSRSMSSIDQLGVWLVVILHVLVRKEKDVVDATQAQMVKTKDSKEAISQISSLLYSQMV